MDQRAIIEMAKKDLAFLEEDVLGVLIYGSWARGESHEKSDIDICIVAPSAEDKIALWKKAIAAICDDRYDVRIFELLPLYLKMAVIEQGVVVCSRDVLELYEYLTPSAGCGGTRSTARPRAETRCERCSGGLAKEKPKLISSR